MAIQQGVIQFRKKLGQTVGRLNANPSLATNVTRGNILSAYQPIVKNPKTDLQGTQRMKMTAAVNFYRMLGQVLNNAYQSTKYGTKSRQRFMSLAMSQAQGIPFVDKEDKKFYPGEYPVSEGSIKPVNVLAIGEGTNKVTKTSLVLGNFVLSGQTLGEVTQQLINKNFGILNGDRITIIEVERDSYGNYVPVYSYFVLDVESTDAIADVASDNKLVVEGVQDSPASFNLGIGLQGVTDPVAAAVIISRAPSTPNGAWGRSSATMVCTADYKAVMMGTDRFNAALQSYAAKVGELSSDWYLNYGISGNTQENGTVGSLTVVSVSNQSVESDQIPYTIAVAVMSDGSKRLLYYGSRFVIVSGSGYAQTNIDYPDDDLLNAFGCRTYQAVDSATEYVDDDRP